MEVFSFFGIESLLLFFFTFMYSRHASETVIQSLVKIAVTGPYPSPPPHVSTGLIYSRR